MRDEEIVGIIAAVLIVTALMAFMSTISSMQAKVAMRCSGYGYPSSSLKFEMNPWPGYEAYCYGMRGTAGRTVPLDELERR